LKLVWTNKVANLWWQDEEKTKIKKKKRKRYKNYRNMQIITCIHGEGFQHRLSALPIYRLTCIPFHLLEKNEKKIKKLKEITDGKAKFRP
jgi:hypothetical protein